MASPVANRNRARVDLDAVLDEQRLALGEEPPAPELAPQLVQALAQGVASARLRQVGPEEAEPRVARGLALDGE